MTGKELFEIFRANSVTLGMHHTNSQVLGAGYQHRPGIAHWHEQDEKVRQLYDAAAVGLVAVPVPQSKPTLTDLIHKHFSNPDCV